MIRFPCSVCNKLVTDNQDAIQCDSCNLWSHRKCNGISTVEYENLFSSENEWVCFTCYENAIPFATSPFNYDSMIGGGISSDISDFLDQLNSLTSSAEFMSEHADVSGVNCKYYNSNEFSLENSHYRNTSFFHLNIGSLSLHFDELKQCLDELGHDFDVIGITETKFHHAVPSSNCFLNNYSLEHTPCEGRKGGALLLFL